MYCVMGGFNLPTTNTRRFTSKFTYAITASDQSEQVPNVVDTIISMTTKGAVRFVWKTGARRQLAYPIRKSQGMLYVLMNIGDCDSETERTRTFVPSSTTPCCIPLTRQDEGCHDGSLPDDEGRSPSIRLVKLLPNRLLPTNFINGTGLLLNCITISGLLVRRKPCVMQPEFRSAKEGCLVPRRSKMVRSGWLIWKFLS